VACGETGPLCHLFLGELELRTNASQISCDATPKINNGRLDPHYSK